VDVHDVRTRIESVAPHHFEETGSADHLAAILYEAMQHLELLGGEMERSAS
jgi:hypothetical protein